MEKFIGTWVDPTKTFYDGMDQIIGTDGVWTYYPGGYVGKIKKIDDDKINLISGALFFSNHHAKRDGDELVLTRRPGGKQWRLKRKEI